MVMLHKHIQRTAFANHISFDGPALQFQGLKSQTQNGTETLTDHAICDVFGVVSASPYSETTKSSLARLFSDSPM